jgi:predicted N-acetyltransferase YhbS
VHADGGRVEVRLSSKRRALRGHSDDVALDDRTLHAMGIERMIRYQREQDVELAEVIAIYRSSTLGERRPIDDEAIVGDMIRHASLVVTARDDRTLVGIARTLTDFSYVGYLADLAVAKNYQRSGIGIGLIRETRRHMGPRSSVVLLAAPAATEYYPHLGFAKVDSAWVLAAGNPLLER